jgi:hypothetical protein
MKLFYIHNRKSNTTYQICVLIASSIRPSVNYKTYRLGYLPIDTVSPI